MGFDRLDLSRPDLMGPGRMDSGRDESLKYRGLLTQPPPLSTDVPVFPLSSFTPGPRLPCLNPLRWFHGRTFPLASHAGRGPLRGERFRGGLVNDGTMERFTEVRVYDRTSTATVRVKRLALRLGLQSVTVLVSVREDIYK